MKMRYRYGRIIATSGEEFFCKVLLSQGEIGLTVAGLTVTGQRQIRFNFKTVQISESELIQILKLKSIINA